MPPIPRHPPFELVPWPLVLLLEDCYAPKSAIHVINAVSKIDPETIAATFACEAFLAEQELEMERNRWN